MNGIGLPAAGLRSLFILSLPRSLSSAIYHLARRALDLCAPAWVSEGEVLNLDRHALAGRGFFDACPKFVSAEADPAFFRRAGAYADAVIRPTGGAYKDVIQPFLASAWLTRADPRLSVLKIEPDIAHVVWAMWRRGWRYPEAAGTSAEAPLRRMIEGLRRAEAAIAATPGETLAFRDFLFSETALPAALARLYPEVEIPPIRHLTPDFLAARERVLARREDPAFRLVAKLADEVR